MSVPSADTRGASDFESFLASAMQQRGEMCRVSVPVLFYEKAPKWHLDLGMLSSLCCFEGLYLSLFMH